MNGYLALGALHAAKNGRSHLIGSWGHGDIDSATWLDFDLPTLADMESYAVGATDDDPYIAMPGFTFDRMNRLNAAMATFQKDVWRELPGPTQPFSLAFGAFKNEWDKFYATSGPGASGWLSRLSGSVMDSVTNYERRLDEWKQKFREIVSAKGGSGLTAPSRGDPVTDPTHPQKKPDDDKMPTWKVVAIAGGVLLVFGGVVYVVSQLGAAKLAAHALL